MYLIKKLWTADETRKTRLHTSNGKLVLSFDMTASLWTTLRRLSVSKYPELPWITYPAIRYLDKRLTGRRVFEYGGGTSTAWYAARARSVTTVENNTTWFEYLQKKTIKLPNVELILEANNVKFPETIYNSDGRFDVIVVDSQPFSKEGEPVSTDDFRVRCLRAAIKKAASNCLFIIDNTDICSNLSEEIDGLFPTRQKLRLAGWVPGILHPNETTIVL